MKKLNKASAYQHLPGRRSLGHPRPAHRHLPASVMRTPLRPTDSLVPTLEAMLADATNPARQRQLKTAIEDLKAGRVAFLMGVPS